jgi:hypothetical protein
LRILLGCVAFLALAAPAPQSSFDLRARYGEPDVQRFAIRPDVTMAVEYGSDGKTCNFDIEPRHAFIHGTIIRQSTISKETALELIDEVAPADTRGKERIPLFSNVISSSCNGQETFGDYDNVQIMIGFGSCELPVGVRSVSVRFKRPVCETSTK